MKKFEKDCLGTKLILQNKSSLFQKSDIKNIENLIEDFEQKYSRFIPWNFLDTLNKEKKALASWELLSMVHLWNKISALTSWYFDITVLPKLENIGYGIQKIKQPEDIWYKNIEIQWDNIILHNNVSIELWGIGKWYLIDAIYNILNKKYENFIINFWGDIRIKWEQMIQLEDPLDDKKSIWEISVNNTAIASTNPRKRATKDWHHLINPYNDTPVDQKLAIFTTHKLAIFADSFATALWVSPLDISIKILWDIKWLEGMIIAEDGKIYTSKWFEAIFYNK